MAADVNCNGCAFYAYPKECHRFPELVKIARPSDHWCGEHKPRPDVTSDPVGDEAVPPRRHSFGGDFVVSRMPEGAILWNEAAASVALDKGDGQTWSLDEPHTPAPERPARKKPGPKPKPKQ